MSRQSLQFEVQPSSGVPIYRQLMDQVLAMVTSGRLVAGDLLPSVRQMADDLQINMMTVSKAWTRLEGDGVLERVRGRGMRVLAQTGCGSVADRRSQLRPLVEPMVTRGLQLDLSEQQILEEVRSVLRERKP